LAGGEAGKVPLRDAGADKTQCGMTNGGGHAANLPVAAFADGERYPGSRDAFALANGRVPIPHDGFDGQDLGG